LAHKSLGRWQDFYLGELGYTSKKPHKIWKKEMTRTLMGKDVRDEVVDVFGATAGKKYPPPCPLWERGNAFLGGKLVGSCVHQDKMLWSNIGKNWVGHKLFLMWPFGERTNQVMDDFWEKLIIAPLNEEETAALKQVCQAVIVEPGDVYVFSGASAHMACGLGDGLNLAAYEAILNFHPDNLEQFRLSNSRQHHYDCRSTREDLDDWNEDVVTNLSEVWAAYHDPERAERPEAPRMLQSVRDAITELIQDDDFCYEFERYRRRKRLVEAKPVLPLGESFDDLIDAMVPMPSTAAEPNKHKAPPPPPLSSERPASRETTPQAETQQEPKVGEKRKKTGFSDTPLCIPC